MTTLASAVAIGDKQIIIDAPFAAGRIPGWVKIDSEMLYAGGQHWRTGTTLTLSAPATATHSQGATVTYAGRPYDADFLAATGGSVVIPRLLGPFRVNFDTPEISTNGVELVGSDVVAGTAIIRAWAQHIDPVEVWDPSGTTELQILDWTTQTYLFALYDPKQTGLPGGELTRSATQLLSFRVATLPTANSLGVYVDIASGTPTAGAADVFAFVVEPA